MHLLRFPEAEAALTQALELDPSDANALANKAVLAVLMGNVKTEGELEGLVAGVREVDERHGLVRDLERMEAVFEEGRARYSASKVAS